MPVIEEKVNNLEALAAQTQIMIQGLSYEVSRTQIQIDNVSRNVNTLGQEMKDFKTYTQATIEEMKQDSKKMRDDMNKKWGDLANKWGTIVEDLVAPNVEALGEKYFNLKDCDTFITNMKKRKPRDKEFDVIAVYEASVILVEVKSTPRTSYIEDFIDFIKNKEFYSFFPEYKDKEVIPVFASLNIPEESVKHLSRNNILAMAMSDNIMDIINPEVIKYLSAKP